MNEARTRTSRGRARRPKDLTKKRIYAGMSLEQAEAAEAQHKRIMGVLTGLLLTQFFGMMANTIVGNAMPVIAAEVGAAPNQYVWIITSAILANTVLTPIAGKLGDLFDKRVLLTIFIGIFMLGSLLAGLSVNAEMLIAVRILQGVGMGGQVMMSVIIMATIIPPRQRGRYNGYQGAVMAVATVSGPFVGGVIVDTPWLGWRWCFFVMIPFMAFAGWVINTRLRLPRNTRTGKVRIDYLGALLVAMASCLLLIWVSMAGTAFPWSSAPSYLMAGGALLLAALFVLVEMKVPEPLIPLHILGSRTTVLAIVASIGVGAMMFGSNVFLGQYFQYGRDFSPTIAGFLGLPMMFGLLISSTWSGRMVTARGNWKWAVVWGTGLMTLGTLAFGLIVHQDTSLWMTSLLLFVAGWGMGMCLQNLVLAVQNTVGLEHMGAATSSVTFFRNLGGAVAIQVLGVLYARQVAIHVERSGVTLPGGASSSSSLDLDALPDAAEAVMRTAYAEGIGPVFLVCALLAGMGFLAAIFMRGTSLRDTVDVEKIVGPRAPDGGATAGEGTSPDGDQPAREGAARSAGHDVVQDGDAERDGAGAPNRDPRSDTVTVPEAGPDRLAVGASTGSVSGPREPRRPSR